MGAESPRREQLRAELEATRAAYHAFAATITPDDWDRPSENPAWSVGELLYHIIMALKYLKEDLTVIRVLRWIPRLPEELFHRFNEWQTARGAKKAGLEGIVAAYDAEHRKVMALLDSIKEDEWDKGVEYPGWDPYLSGFVSIEKLFQYITHHFEEHKAEIERSLGRVKGYGNDGFVYLCAC